MSPPRIREMINTVRHIPVATDVSRDAIQLTLRTHSHHPQATPAITRYVRHGASPRAAQTMILGAKVRAILAGRFHVAREDIHAIAYPAIRHRLILNLEAHTDQIVPDTLIRELIETL